MAKLSTHHSASITKALFIGDSGTGKTGALASLAKAGFNLRIMDYDNGLDVLANLLRSDPAALARIDYVTLTDKFKAMPNGRLQPVSADAWTRGVKLLDNWPELGPITSWTSQDILVIDSLNFAGKAATRFITQMSGRLAAPPQWNDYYDAQRLVESLCAMLYSESVACNVLALSHIREVGKTQTIEKDGKAITVEEEGSRRGYAETGTGKALSPTIGRYFNAVLMADIMGSGHGTRRVIRTIPHDNVGLKNPAPGIVKPQYPLETGLAEYFTAVRGEVQPEAKAS